MRRQALLSPRHRALRKKRVVRFSVAFAAAVLSLCAAIVIFFNSGFVRVSSINVVSDDAVLGASVQSVIDNTVLGSYIGIIPKNSALFFPFHSLDRAIRAQFPAVASVSFSRHGLTGIQATVRERQTAEIVCVASNDCYDADAGGIIFKETATTTGPYLIYELTLPKGTQVIGLQFIDSGRLTDVSVFVAGLSKLGFSTDSISVLPDRQYAFSLRGVSAQASSTMKLFINEDRPFPLALQDFSAFWQTHLASAAAGKEKPSLSSVDMRYGDNIIYKTR